MSVRPTRRALSTAVCLTAAAAVLAGLTAAPSSAAPSSAAPGGKDRAGGPTAARFATFNVSMFRNTDGELARDLAVAADEKQDEEVRNVAEIIQRQRPDVLLLNEFDHDQGGVALRRFQDNFLDVAQAPGVDPIDYPYAVAFPSNTGIASGFDLNRNGTVGTSGRAYGDDSFGFGEFPGQYAFAVLSRFPLDIAGARTFQRFRWADMPGARLPDDAATAEPGDFYSDEVLEVFRLSSKNHVDLPVRVGGRTVHLLASHPTPPVFDGPEDRNGTRNADEIRLWQDYVTPGAADYLLDDAGRRGGLDRGAAFVVMGDLNADPAGDGDGVAGAAAQIVEQRFVRDPLPSSAGGSEASRLQGGANLGHRGDPALDTADFNDRPGASGNLRADYVLPSRPLGVRDAGVFWPVQADPLSRLTGVFNPSFSNGFPSSDHRMVWVDLSVPGGGGGRP